MVANALIGYSNPKLVNKYPVKYELIDHLMSHIEDLTVAESSRLLEFYCQNQKGDKELLLALKDHIKTLAQDPAISYHIPMIFTSFKIMGANSSDFKPFLHVLH